MNVLLTGAAGFVGSHMLKYLMENTDWNIVCLVRLGKIGDLNRIVGFDQDSSVDWGGRYIAIWHDLLSPIPDYVSDRIGKIDHIIHMGAETHVDRSITNPMEFVMSNIVGTANLLDYARKIKLSGYFLQFSTDEVFGPAPKGVEHEEHFAYRAGNPYAATKAGAEQLVMSYGTTYGLKTLIIRSMNIFGERQHKEKYIPMVIRKARDGELVTIHANPSLTEAGSRFYTYAQDVASAVHFVMNRKYTQVDSMRWISPMFHVVGELEVGNLTLAQKIATIQGKELKYEMVNFHQSRPGHDLRYALKDTKLNAMGWKRKHTFEESLEKTVKWYLNNKEWL